MRDRGRTIGPIAAVAGALGLCCGLPVLLSVGVLGGIAGWSLQSWGLIGIGFVLAALGLTRMVRGRRHDKSCHQPGAVTPVDTTTVRTANSSTDDTARENSP